MGRLIWLTGFAGLFSALVAGGCVSRNPVPVDPTKNHYEAIATQIEYPDVETEVRADVAASATPWSVRGGVPVEPWRLTLQEVIHLTLANSQVVRDSGGRVLNTPGIASTVFEPAIRETDPRFSPEAALAAFDAEFTTSLFFNKTERTTNNIFFGGGATSVGDQTNEFQAFITKTAPTGTRFVMRNITGFQEDNLPEAIKTFSTVYNTTMEFGFRHPLLQGSGLTFNRIAGPNATPGNYNGVVLSRINTDIALVDFEVSVRDLLADVERAYWELYFAYRDLDSRIAARNLALETWRAEKAKLEQEFTNQEIRAREQYYTFEVTVVAGLDNVYAAERRLRSLVGVPPSDGRLIRPAEEPTRIDVVFDWNESLAQAMWRRAELRRQRWTLKRRELELVASRNFQQMRLDVIGQYRFKGFGDNLFGQYGYENSSAFEDLFDGNLQDWQLGLELSTPIGNRTGHLAVRAAEWQLARERAVLEEQELQVAHQLSNAIAELDRAYATARVNYNRRVAAYEQLAQEQAKQEELKGGRFDFLLDAQRRVLEAESSYYRSLADHSIAIANVHLAEGTLLDYMQISLAEGPWSGDAHASAIKQSRRFRPKLLNYCLEQPCHVSRGVYPQRLGGFETLPPGMPSDERPIHSGEEAPGERNAPLPIPGLRDERPQLQPAEEPIGYGAQPISHPRPAHAAQLPVYGRPAPPPVPAPSYRIQDGIPDPPNFNESVPLPTWAGGNY